MKDEYVKKSNVFEALRRHYPYATLREGTTFYHAVEDLKNLPAADVVEVVHGEWVNHVNPMNDDDWACSACGGWFCFEAGDPVSNGTNYCPSCGARMDKAEAARGGDHADWSD